MFLAVQYLLVSMNPFLSMIWSWSEENKVFQLLCELADQSGDLKKDLVKKERKKKQDFSVVIKKTLTWASSSKKNTKIELGAL